MNKPWSIILIVVACIVVLGGTYWYFGMQKPKTLPPIAKTNAVVASSSKTEQSLPKQVVEPKVKPATGASPTGQAVTPSIPAEKPKPIKQLPAPIAPAMTKEGGFALPSFGDTPIALVMTKDGGFALPSFGNTSEKAIAEKKAHTSVLASEELPSKAEVSNIPAIEKEKAKKLEPVEAIPENKQEIIPAAVLATLPAVKILRSDTASAEEMATDDKPAIEANLSVSFLDYDFPKEFSFSEKGFNVSMDVMSQKKVFGWGGTLEVGKNITTKVVQISLLGKAAWRLAKDRVTFPLSISLGPMLFIDSEAKTTEFGMKAKLGAGVTYAISESFRMFYAVGVGVTYNFQDSTSFRFVMEPIRVGIGFSF